jgi:hypothetical protein
MARDLNRDDPLDKWEEQGRADARAGLPLFILRPGDEGAPPDQKHVARRKAQDAELAKMAREAAGREIEAEKEKDIEEEEKQASDVELARGDAERYAKMWGIPFENAFRTLSQLRGLPDTGQPDTPPLDEGTATLPDYFFAPAGFTAPEAPTSQDTYRYINPTTEQQWEAPLPGQWGLPEEWQSADKTGADYAQWQPRGFLQDAERLSTSFGIPIRDAVTSLAMSRGKTPSDFLGSIIPRGIGSISPPEGDISSAEIRPQSPGPTIPGGEEGFVFDPEEDEVRAQPPESEEDLRRGVFNPGEDDVVIGPGEEGAAFWPGPGDPIFPPDQRPPLTWVPPEGPSKEYVGVNQPAPGLVLYPSDPAQQGEMPGVLRAEGGTVKGIPIQKALASLASRRGQTPQGFLGGLDSRGIGGLG